MENKLKFIKRFMKLKNNERTEHFRKNIVLRFDHH
jgi:hypothetical protein